jgi:hypothetical protein
LTTRVADPDIITACGDANASAKSDTNIVIAGRDVHAGLVA